MIVQHCWVNKKDSCPHPTYDDFIHTIKWTNRDWNSTLPLRQILRYLSFTTHTNINLVRFKLQKDHSCHDKMCYQFKYEFQNTFIKLMFNSSHFEPFVLIQHQNTLYAVNSFVNMAPYLIAGSRTPCFVYEGYSIVTSHLQAILTSSAPSSFTFPFSIRFYTTFSYAQSPQNKINPTHLMGCYNPPMTPTTTLHLFVTPMIDAFCAVFFTYLDNDTQQKMLCHKNQFSIPHPTEGIPLLKPNIEPSVPPLNHKFCICDHPKTKNFNVPSQQSFKPLGNMILRFKESVSRDILGVFLTGLDRSS